MVQASNGPMQKVHLSRQLEVRALLRQKKELRRQQNLNFGKDLKLTGSHGLAGKWAGRLPHTDSMEEAFGNNQTLAKILLNSSKATSNKKTALSRTKAQDKMAQTLTAVSVTSWYDENVTTSQMEKYKERTNEDGFEFLFKYSQQEGRLLKALYTCDRGDTFGVPRPEFLSLDTRSMQLWTVGGQQVAHHTLTKGNFHLLKSVCYVPTLQIFLAAAADMTVRVFDRALNEIDLITTGERAFLHLLYDATGGKVISGGVDGCVAWQLHRRLDASGLSTKYSLVQTHAFKKCQGWISQLVLIEDERNALVVQDSSLSVYDLDSGEDLLHLARLHDKTVTAAMWYPRSQYYLTGCVEGKIKIWAMHSEKTGREVGKRQKQRARSKKKKGAPHALLHTFKSHSKSITGFAHHPLPDIIISSSLDCTICLWNLDSLVLFNVLDLGNPLVSLQVVQPDKQKKGQTPESVLCLFGTEQESLGKGEVLVYSINNFSHLLGMCRGSISAIRAVEPKYNWEKQADGTRQTAGQSQEMLPSPSSWNENQTSETPERIQEPANHKPMLLIQCGSLDVRLLDIRGICATFVPFGTLMEGLLQCEFCFQHMLLLCLLNSGMVKVFCCKQSPAVLLTEWQSPSSSAHNQISTMCLIDIEPDHHRIINQSQIILQNDTVVADARGEFPNCTDRSILVVGCVSGEMIFMDLMQNARVLMTFQAHNAKIVKITFCRACSMIAAVFKSEGKCCIKGWRMPSVEMVFKLTFQEAPTCVVAGKEFPFLAIGWKDGAIELLQLDRTHQPQAVDGYVCEEQHAGPVTCIEFHDGLQVFLSAGGDKTLRIWSISGFILQRITLQQEPAAACFVEITGAIVVGQDQNALEIPFEKWMPTDLLAIFRRAGLNCFPFLANDKTGFIEQKKKQRRLERRSILAKVPSAPFAPFQSAHKKLVFDSTSEFFRDTPSLLLNPEFDQKTEPQSDQSVQSTKVSRELQLQLSLVFNRTLQSPQSLDLDDNQQPLHSNEMNQSQLSLHSYGLNFPISPMSSVACPDHSSKLRSRDIDIHSLKSVEQQSPRAAILDILSSEALVKDYKPFSPRKVQHLLQTSPMRPVSSGRRLVESKKSEPSTLETSAEFTKNNSFRKGRRKEEKESAVRPSTPTALRSKRGVPIRKKLSGLKPLSMFYGSFYGYPSLNTGEISKANSRSRLKYPSSELGQNKTPAPLEEGQFSDSSSTFNLTITCVPNVAPPAPVMKHVSPLNENLPRKCRSQLSRTVEACTVVDFSENAALMEVSTKMIENKVPGRERPMTSHCGTPGPPSLKKKTFSFPNRKNMFKKTDSST